MIRLIRQQIECGDVFGLQVIPRAPLPLWSVAIGGPASRAICCPPEMLIGPPGAGVVGSLLQQAGGHVATRIPLGFLPSFPHAMRVLL